MTRADAVTVAVPVYGAGGGWLRETLAAIQRQTHRDLTALVSLDGPQPEAARAVWPFLADRRFQLVTHPARIGWAANLQTTIDRARTPFWCFVGHDDLLAPDFLEALVAEAARSPDAAIVYPDIEAFGGWAGVIRQPPVVGEPVARMRTLLSDHFAAVAIHGVLRVDALRRSGGIPPNPVEDFACDAAAMLAAARWGDLVRVPRALYRKRYHAGSEHMRWFAWPLEQRVRAWIHHCAAALEHALAVPAAPAQRAGLWLAAVGRLVSPRVTLNLLDVADWDEAALRDLLEGFLAHVGASPLDVAGALALPWPEVCARTRAAFPLLCPRAAT